MLNVAQLSGVAAQLSECWPSSRWETPPRPRPNFRARRFHTSLDLVACHVLLQRPDISPFLITVFTFDHLPLSGIISSLIHWHSYHFHALHSSSFLSCLLLCFYIYKLLITLFTFDSFPLGGESLIPQTWPDFLSRSSFHTLRPFYNPIIALPAVASSSTSTFNWRTFQPGQYKLAIGQKIQFTAIWGAGEELQWNYPICSNLLEVISRLSSSQSSQLNRNWFSGIFNSEMGFCPQFFHGSTITFEFCDINSTHGKTSLVKCEKVNIGEGFQRGQPPAGRFQIWIQPNIWSLAKWVGGRWVTLQRLFCQRQTIAT